MADRTPGCGPVDGDDMMLDFIESEADRLGQAAVARLIAEPSLNKDTIRNKLRRSLGLDEFFNEGIPGADLLGRDTIEGVYRDRLILQLSPDLDVPADLWRPVEAARPAPGVLYSVGHWMRLGKREPMVEAFGVMAARSGFITLVIESIGQGERGPSMEDHGRLDFLLTGVSQQGLMVSEHLRALDYLTTRDDIDPTRIGMTGASGGGLTTMFTTALDPRIAAAVSVCASVSYRHLLRSMRRQNWDNHHDLCNQVPNIIRDLEMAGLCRLIAPRPLLLIGASQDEHFTVDGMADVFQTARRLYGESAECAIDWVTVDGDHGYSAPMRRLACDWFTQWLLDTSSPVTPSTPNDVPHHDTATAPGRPPTSDQAPGSGLRRFAHTRAEWTLRNRQPLPSAQHTRTALRTVLDIASPDLNHQATGRKIGTVKSSSHLDTEHEVASEPGISLPVRVVTASVSEPVGVAVVLADHPRSDNGFLERLSAMATRSRCHVAMLDPRGTGNIQSRPGPTMTYATLDGGLDVRPTPPEATLEFEVATDAMMLGRGLLGQQVLDIIRTAEYLARAHSTTPAPIGLIGTGVVSSLRALFAAALMPHVQVVAADRLLTSYTKVLGHGYTEADFPITACPFAILKTLDIPDVTALFDDQSDQLEPHLPAGPEPFQAWLGMSRQHTQPGNHDLVDLAIQLLTLATHPDGKVQAQETQR